MSAPKYLFSVTQIVADGRVKQTDIDKIKSWSLHQKHVPDISDQQIVAFLLSCCNDFEATKATIVAYYSLQGASEILNDRSLDRQDMQKVLRTIQIGVLPERTSEDYAIVVLKLEDPTYYNLEMGPAIKLGIMTLNSIVYNNPPNGFIVILDMKGIGLMHLTRVVFRLLKPFFNYVQEALPIRLEAILILNTVYFINKIMKIIKPFLHAKLIEKMHFHTPHMDLDLFLSVFLNKQCTPWDYGGTSLSIEELHTMNTEKLSNMATFFEAEELQRTRAL